MGQIEHKAVVATLHLTEDVEKVDKWIESRRSSHRQLFAKLPSWANGYVTYCLAPDGSKEGWPTSKDGDRLRDSFINFLEEGDLGCWAEVLYGGCTPDFIARSSNLWDL